MSKSFSTSDIQIAATLLAIGINMDSPPTVSQKNVGTKARAVFHFPKSTETDAAVVGYTNNTLKASPRELFARLRELKSMVFNIL